MSRKLVQGLAFLLVAGILWLFPKTTTKAGEYDKRILFISSYSLSWSCVQNQIVGLEETLDSSATVDYEFMDTRRVYDKTSVSLFYSGLKYRLEKQNPYDIIVLGDDAALDFAMEYQNELFPEIPMLFLGVNNEALAEEALTNPYIAGMAQTVFPEENIAWGLAMKPHAQKVYAISDGSPAGKAGEELLHECESKYPDLEFEIMNASEYTDIQFKRKIRSVESDNILLYISMTGDANGKQYSCDEISLLLKECSKTPAITLTDMGIGEGLAGGYVVSMENAGRKIGEMALSIMRGQDVSKVQQNSKEPAMWIVDEMVLRQCGVDVSSIPSGAEVLNRKTTYFERNQEMMKPAIAITGVMLLVILIICIDNIRHRKLLRELEEARAIMKSASQHDFLTGLANRSKFMEDFEAVVEKKKPCTVMMIDIDDFKSINDTYGHTAGDEALQQLAGRLKELQSQILTAYRFAGDEFIIMLRSNQEKIVEKSAFACRQVFSKDFIICGQKMKIGGSIGIASYPKDADAPEQLVICADDAMYEVKKNGKNTLAFYHGEKRAEADG